MRNSLFSRNTATLGGLTVVAILALSSTGDAQTLTDAQIAQRLKIIQQGLQSQISQAEKVCLSGRDAEASISLTGIIKRLGKMISGGGTVQVQYSTTLGAARDFPRTLMKVENDSIRNCMKPYVEPVFGTYQRQLDALADSINPPPLQVEFRFNYKRIQSLDQKAFMDSLILATQSPQVFRSSIIMQDPNGLQYFNGWFAYPQVGRPIRGIISPERRASSVRSSNAPLVTPFCLDRGTPPALGGTNYDLFACTEAGKCGAPSAGSTGILKLCTASSAALSGRIETAMANTSVPLAEGAGDHWSVPSLTTLAGSKTRTTKAGYTIFYLDTDRLKGSDAQAVQVDIRVNGVPIYEDGLPPQYRPVALEKNGHLSYSFALQSLNFEGRYAGCEHIQIGLRTISAAGAVGPEQKAALRYVSLRDAPPQQAALGTGTMQWSAGYQRAKAEMIRMVFLKSYGYAAPDNASRAAAVARAEKDKAWLDAQGFSFGGNRVVGVLRPPRTINGGKAAYGLMAGVKEPSGAIRFVFDNAGAASLLRQLKVARDNPAAKAIILPDSYPSDAGIGLISPPQFCAT